MADYLASIFGTEKDKVNCSFYFKIGACRHGERCSRIHNKPTFSQTILLQNLYQNPQNVTSQTEGAMGKEITIQRVHTMSDEEAQEHFDDFFEDVFIELEDKYGEIEEMNVCDNLGDHLVGNVYVKFRREEDAERAVQDLNNRWFGARPIYAELSPVTDFREACCRQYEMGECTRSGFCNFMHIKPISRELRRELYGRRRADAMEKRNQRSRTPERRSDRRSRERDYRSRRDRERERDRGHRSKESRSSSKRYRSKSRSRSKDKEERSSHRHRSSHRSSRRSKDKEHRSSKDRHHDENDGNDSTENQQQHYKNEFDPQGGTGQFYDDYNNSNSGNNEDSYQQHYQQDSSNYDQFNQYQQQQDFYSNNGEGDQNDEEKNFD